MTERVIVAGVDGGASSTTCVLADGDGRIIGTGRGGPVDHLYRTAGRQRTRESLREAILAAMRRARLRRPLRVRALVAGLTGLEPESPESQAAVRIIRSLVRADVIRVTWDAEIAFHGATGGGPGVIVIAGTGSVAFGRNAAGRTARAGGYGYLLDDAGGGVGIGQAAVRAALRSTDGRGPSTRLWQMLRKRLGDWPQIRSGVYGESGGRALLASLVPVVAVGARRGDKLAREILEDAGRSLADLAIAVAGRLDMIDDEEFDLFPAGGVFVVGKHVLDPLRKSVRSRAPRARIRRPRYPPVIGAVLMALGAAGIEPSAQALRRLKASSAVRSR